MQYENAWFVRGSSLECWYKFDFFQHATSVSLYHAERCTIAVAYIV